MSATRFNDAALALAAAYAAAPGLSGVPVYDTVQSVTFSDPDFVVIGHDGSLAADGTLSASPTGGTWTQQDVAEGIREESGYVNCLIISQSGDVAGMAARRQRASDLLQAAEDAVTGTAAYPASAPGLMFDGTADGRWIPWLSQGAAVIVAYRVYYSTGWN